MMRRWISGLSTPATILSVVCNALMVVLAAGCVTVLIARRIEPTNGTAGLLPAYAAVAVVAAVVLLWYLKEGHLWARCCYSILDGVALGVGFALQCGAWGAESVMVILGGAIIVVAGMGLATMWVPLPERTV